MKKLVAALIAVAAFVLAAAGIAAADGDSSYAVDVLVTQPSTYVCPSGTTSTGLGPTLVCTSFDGQVVPAELYLGSGSLYWCPAGTVGAGGTEVEDVICTTDSGEVVSALSTFDIPGTSFSCPDGSFGVGSGLDLRCFRVPVYVCPVDTTAAGTPPNLTCTSSTGDVVDPELDAPMSAADSCPGDAIVSQGGTTICGVPSVSYASQSQPQPQPDAPTTDGCPAGTTLTAGVSGATTCTQPSGAASIITQAVVSRSAIAPGVVTSAAAPRANTRGIGSPAVDYGFNSTTAPAAPALAVTGTETAIFQLVATALIALGALALGSRRSFIRQQQHD